MRVKWLRKRSRGWVVAVPWIFVDQPGSSKYRRACGITRNRRSFTTSITTVSFGSNPGDRTPITLRNAHAVVYNVLYIVRKKHIFGLFDDASRSETIDDRLFFACDSTPPHHPHPHPTRAYNSPSRGLRSRVIMCAC